MKRALLLIFAVAVASGLISGIAQGKDSSTPITKSLLKQVADQWKTESDKGALKLNPSTPPKVIPNETTAPSIGPKHDQATTTPTPVPNATASTNNTTTTSDTCPSPSCYPPGTPPPAGYPVANVALVSNGSSFTSAELATYAQVLQDWLNQQYVYKWNEAATVQPYGSVADWQNSLSGRWPVFVNSSCPACEGTGYHDATINSAGVCLPWAEVQDQTGDHPYTEGVISHEMGEMITNPSCGSQDRVVSYNGTHYYVELDDPTEEYDYAFENHVIENWEFPKYWQPGQAGPYNWLGLTQGYPGRTSGPLYPVCGPQYPYGDDYQLWSRPGVSAQSYDCAGITY